MLPPEVKWRPDADRTYRACCARYRRASEAIDGALRAIAAAGSSQRAVPNTDGRLRQVQTMKGAGAPAFLLLFTWDVDAGCYWVEQINEISA